MTDERLRKRVFDAMSRGHLPSSFPRRSWAGNGTGDICALCERPITEQQLEREFQDSKEPTRSYHLHLQCADACESVMGGGSAIPEPGLAVAGNDGYSAADDRVLGKGTTP